MSWYLFKYQQVTRLACHPSQLPKTMVMHTELACGRNPRLPIGPWGTGKAARITRASLPVSRLVFDRFPHEDIKRRLILVPKLASSHICSPHSVRRGGVGSTLQGPNWREALDVTLTSGTRLRGFAPLGAEISLAKTCFTCKLACNFGATLWRRTMPFAATPQPVRFRQSMSW
jgi:hypothetical protein